jgi:hypothetical protein
VEGMGISAVAGVMDCVYKVENIHDVKVFKWLMDKLKYTLKRIIDHGINAAPGALKEVGRRYKEQNHGLFGWDFEDHTGVSLPDDFALPDGTMVQFRRNSHSNYLVALEKATVASEGESCQVKWLHRPAYYSQKPPPTIIWSRLGKLRQTACFIELLQPFCEK